MDFLDIVKELRKQAENSPISERFRLAFSLGEIDSESAGALLADLALDHSSDPYFVAGAMSSLVPHVESVAKAAAAASRTKRAALLPYLFETAAADAWWRRQVCHGLFCSVLASPTITSS